MLRIKVGAMSLFLHVIYFVYPSSMHYPHYESNKETFARTVPGLFPGPLFPLFYINIFAVEYDC